MKNFFKRFCKPKYVPKVNPNRLADARFELNEMLVGVNHIKTRSSIQFWVERLFNSENIDFLIVSLQLIQEEIDRQKQAGINPSKNIIYPERRQFKP